MHTKLVKFIFAIVLLGACGKRPLVQSISSEKVPDPSIHANASEPVNTVGTAKESTHSNPVVLRISPQNGKLKTQINPAAGEIEINYTLWTLAVREGASSYPIVWSDNFGIQWSNPQSIFPNPTTSIEIPFGAALSCPIQRVLAGFQFDHEGRGYLSLYVQDSKACRDWVARLETAGNRPYPIYFYGAKTTSGKFLDIVKLGN